LRPELPYVNGAGTANAVVSDHLSIDRSDRGNFGSLTRFARLLYQPGCVECNREGLTRSQVSNSGNLPTSDQLPKHAGDVCKGFTRAKSQIVTVGDRKDVTPDLVRISAVGSVVVRILRTTYNPHMVERAIPGVLSLETQATAKVGAKTLS
jgi:hypothetical protein